MNGHRCNGHYLDGKAGPSTTCRMCRDRHWGWRLVGWVDTLMDHRLAVKVGPSMPAANTLIVYSLGQTMRAAGDGQIEVDDHNSYSSGYMQGELEPLRYVPFVGSFFWLAPFWRKGTVIPSLVWGWRVLACIITSPNGEATFGYLLARMDNLVTELLAPNDKHETIQFERGQLGQSRVARVISRSREN